jgi:purine-binding chemotaxis protein CheW
VREAISAGGAETLYVLCRVRERWCAIPIDHVAEIMRPQPVTALTAAPSFVLGLALIRGQPSPVVDAGQLFGGPERSLHTRFLSLKTGRRTTMLAVEAVAGVRRLPSGLGELPPLLREASTVAVAAVRALDSELLRVLNSARLVPESVLESLYTWGAAR